MRREDAMSGPAENRIRAKGSTKVKWFRGFKLPLASVALVMLGVSALSLVSCTPVKTASASPRVLAEDTASIVQDITTDEKDIFSVMVDNFETVRQLQASVSTSDDPSDMVNDVLTQLEQVAKSFEDMSNKRDKTRNEFLDKVSELPKLMERAEGEIDALKARKAEYEQKLTGIDASASDSQKALQLSITQAVTYVTRQIEIWEQFTSTQSAIQDQVDTVGTRIDAFMDIIDGNAVVYREAVNLLKLQRDIREALSVVTEGIPEIERLSKEMQDSWETLNSLVDELLVHSAASPEDGSTPEATLGATSESTPEATPEAAPESTPQVTPEPTSESTPEATPEPTPQVTPESTPTEQQ